MLKGNIFGYLPAVLTFRCHFYFVEFSKQNTFYMQSYTSEELFQNFWNFAINWSRE